jgi:predicted transcriptional regulator
MAVMETLKIGIASYEEMKARTMAIARGELKPSHDEPKVWFTSLESLGQVLSSGNVALLQVIASRKPRSIQELAELTGKQKSNLSRTLKTMARYGIIRFEQDHSRRVPIVAHHRFVLDFSLRTPVNEPDPRRTPTQPRNRVKKRQTNVAA